MTQSPVQGSQRLVSLDVFRGATVAAMILVNNPGSYEEVFAQFGHAPWHGWTMTDWIFPFFLWIMGVAMTMSLARRRKQGQSNAGLVAHAVRRTFLLFAIGVALNGFPFGLLGDDFGWGSLRIPGVLQRIAACYAAAFLIINAVGVRGLIFWCIGILAGYWLIMGLVPVPGFGAGVLEPQGNLAWFIDSRLLAGHTWEHAPAAGFDPEGILSTLPAIATTLLGALTGTWFSQDGSPAHKAGWMFVGGTCGVIVGLLFDMAFPINKNLWTSSYVVFTAGWALLCFASLFWIIEVWGRTQWTAPFAAFGVNAMMIFVLSGIIGRLLWAITWSGYAGEIVYLQEYLGGGFLSLFGDPRIGSLLYAVTFLLAMYAVVWGMWKRNIVIKL